jgi:hypothetical protein
MAQDNKDEGAIPLTTVLTKQSTVGAPDTKPAETEWDRLVPPDSSMAIAPRAPDTAPTAWDALSAQDPSAATEMKVYGAHVAKSAVEGLPTTAGMMTGAAVGSAFFPPVGTIVGAIGGGILGYLGGEKFVTPHVEKKAAEITPYAEEPLLSGLVPYAEAGKTTGSIVSTIPFSFGLPNLVKQAGEKAVAEAMGTGVVDTAQLDRVRRLAEADVGKVSKFISKQGTFARSAPLLNITSETLAGLSSGALGGSQVYYNPESPGARLGAEIVGGFLFPPKVLVTGLASLKGVLTKAKQVPGIILNRQQQRAQTLLYDVLDRAGEDPDALIQLLDDPRLITETPTVAQITGSTTIRALENTLLKLNANYGQAITTQGKRALAAYQSLIQQLSDIGTPDALRQAAQMRSGLFNDLLTNRLTAAELEATTTSRRINVKDPDAEMKAANNMQVHVADALSDGRSYERQLYDQAERDSVVVTNLSGKRTKVAPRQVQPLNAGTTFLEMASRFTPARFKEGLPPAVRSIMAEFGVTPETIERYSMGKLTKEYLDTKQVPKTYLKIGGEDIIPTVPVSYLIKARSDLLDFTRSAAAKGDVAEASIYAQMGESLLADMDSLGMPAYDNARAYSRSLNDTFTRTFANKVTSTTTTGAQRYTPEMLVNEVFRGSGDMTARRMLNMEEAVNFPATKYAEVVNQFGVNSPQALALKPLADNAATRVNSIRDAQSRLLMSAASDSINPLTGRVDPLKLTKFVNENENILKRLNIFDDLSDATTAELTLRNVTDRNSELMKTIGKQSAFAKVLEVENPTQAVINMLNPTKNPIRNMQKLVNLARKGGPDAVDGLKSSIFEYAYNKAVSSDGTIFNADKFQQILFEPLSKSQPSLMQMMSRNGLVNAPEMGRTRDIVNAMQRVTKAMEDPTALGKVLEDADALTQLAFSIVGSHLGTALAPKGVSGLIASSAAGKFLRLNFLNNPQFLVQGVLEEATKDPALFKALLSRPKDAEQGLRLQIILHKYGITAAKNYAEFDPENPPMYEEEPSSGFGPRVNRMPPRKMPPAAAPNTRGINSPPESPAAAPAGGPPPQASAGPSSKDLYRQLFPLDMA